MKTIATLNALTLADMRAVRIELTGNAAKVQSKAAGVRTLQALRAEHGEEAFTAALGRAGFAFDEPEAEPTPEAAAVPKTIEEKVRGGKVTRKGKAMDPAPPDAPRPGTRNRNHLRHDGPARRDHQRGAAEGPGVGCTFASNCRRFAKAYGYEARIEGKGKAARLELVRAAPV